MKLATQTIICWVVLLAASVLAADEKSSAGNDVCPASASASLDDFFRNEVWAKVASKSCITCHKPGGDAEDSQFVLRDPARALGDARAAALRHNGEAFARMAKLPEGDQSRILLKVTGELDHGGDEVLPADSAGYRILAEYVRRVNAPAKPHSDEIDRSVDQNAPPFFAGVKMLDDRQLLRRITMSLAARLPTPEEQSAVDDDGRDALPAILDALMNEEAFYTRLREGFNDIFLTVGYNDLPESALSYRHFGESRIWYQKFDLSHIEDEKERKQAGYKLTREYRAALLGEPMQLVDYIVRNDRPFTEIVTADYIMVTPYTARGYGIYDEVRSRFEDPDDPFEYIPVRLKSLTGRSPSDNQKTPTGFYPHAGMLSMFQYLRRYPTTETNRNRLRTRMVYEHFLGVDLMQLAPRVSDAAAVTAKYEIPTMQAAECVVCHRTVDPVAGLFQEYYDLKGVYGPRKEGWYEDMFGPGFEGEALPAEERWRALPWLGERTAKDPRFAVAMVQHVYYVLTGRKVLLPPTDLDDPHFAARRRAYAQQHCMIEQIAERFSAEGFQLKNVFKELVLTDFYRADGLATVQASPERLAELDDIGVVRLLSPEQLERKIAAIFGAPWGRLKDDWAMLYGGIDSKEVTERASDPSGALGAIQRIMANDVAAAHTLADFALPAQQRRLFPGIEPSVLPATSPEADREIREAIMHLHALVLGRDDAIDSPEIDRSYELFAGIVNDAKGHPDVGKSEIYHARRDVDDAPADPDYTIRAWRAVVTYLLRRREFLYE